MAASITDLKKHPMQVVNSAGGEALAILNHNEPVFYCVPAKKYEEILDLLDDLYLAKVVRERENEPMIKVNLDDL
jgi:antitoxin StbD